MSDNWIGLIKTDYVLTDAALEMVFYNEWTDSQSLSLVDFEVALLTSKSSMTGFNKYVECTREKYVC